MNKFFTSQNCPYIVIGVSSCAPVSEAAVSFARASRRLKAREDAPFTLQELTSALSRIESGVPSGDLVFVVPADPELSSHKIRELASWAANKNHDELIEMTELDLSKEDSHRVSLALLSAGLESLLMWESTPALKLLKSCLSVSRDEQIRDEALNLVAACLVMDDDIPKAIKALSKAVEGKWNLGLRRNLSMLEIHEDPKGAIEQMSYLVSGAVGATEKLAAIRMAIGLWRQVQESTVGNVDLEDLGELPDDLLKSFLETLISQDISEEDFFDLGIFLAIVASKSLTEKLLKKSKFAERATAKTILAKSRGGEFYFENVVRIAYEGPNQCKRVDVNIEQFVEEIVQKMFEDGGLANLAFSFLEQGLGVETLHRIWLRGALVLCLPKLLADDIVPNERFVVWLIEAKRESKILSLTPEIEKTTSEIMNDASDVLMQLQLRDFFLLASDVENLSNQIAQQMSGFFSRLAVDRADVRQRSRNGIAWCDEQLKMFTTFETLGLTDADLRSEVRKLQEATRVIRQNFVKFI